MIIVSFLKKPKRMIVSILSSILFIIFATLSGFHFYWVLGGIWGLESVFPTKSNEPNNTVIPKFATLIVALILSSFSLIYLVKTDILIVQLPNWIDYVYWIIPSFFTLRAIGEFNYVGFFKKVKDTAFAKADSTIFDPLCLFIGVIGAAIQLI